MSAWRSSMLYLWSTTFRVTGCSFRACRQWHSLEQRIQSWCSRLNRLWTHYPTSLPYRDLRCDNDSFFHFDVLDGKASGVKMVLSGEGADEIFGGYLYFHKAPNAEEFHEETLRKLFALHEYDCLRANKAKCSFGVEAWVPFLDVDFLDTAMSLDPTSKMYRHRAEKHCIRSAFDTPERPFLPQSVLLRQKEQFSDGVGYSWFDGLREYADEHVSDSMMELAKFRFPHGTPPTKEAYLYRQMFKRYFPSDACIATVRRVHR